MVCFMMNYRVVWVDISFQVTFERAEDCHWCLRDFILYNDTYIYGSF